MPVNKKKKPRDAFALLFNSAWSGIKRPFVFTNPHHANDNGIPKVNAGNTFPINKPSQKINDDITANVITDKTNIVYVAISNGSILFFIKYLIYPLMRIHFKTVI